MADPVHILLIGEDATIRERCDKVLAAEGYRVDQTRNGLEGLDRMRLSVPHLLILGPGGRTAHEFDARVVKALDPLAVIIAVDSSDTVEGDVERAGHVVYERLARSFTPGQLLSAVHRGLEVRRLRTRMKELDSASEESRRAAFSFITTVAHELRAPLAAIESYLSAYLSGAAGPDPDVNRRMLERARVRSHTLIDLVGDLLQFTRLESTGMPRRMVVLDLGEIIGNTVELFRRQAEERSITMETDLPDRLPPIEAHPSEMEQLLTNLISNAIKYNKEGGKVTITAEEVPGYLRIAVSDTGIGISDEEQGRVFEEFYRASRPETRYTMGTGLGLTIVKKIVESHAGRISVESRENEGTTFVVELPIYQGNEIALARAKN